MNIKIYFQLVGWSVNQSACLFEVCLSVYTHINKKGIFLVWQKTRLQTHFLHPLLRFKSWLGHSKIWVRSRNWTIPPPARVIRSNDNGIQEQGWEGRYFMRHPACSRQVYRCPRGSLGVPIWAAASRRFGLFGRICDSANSSNSPLLGAAGEDRGVVEGSATDRLIGWRRLGTQVLRVLKSKWRVGFLILYFRYFDILLLPSNSFLVEFSKTFCIWVWAFLLFVLSNVISSDNEKR